jgi:hypothetical protein
MAPIGRRPTREELLDGLKTSLTERLPPTWSVDVQRHTGPYSDRLVPDATLTVSAPDGRTATVPIEIKERLHPKDVTTMAARVHEMMSGSDERPLILTPYITFRTRQRLADNGLSYATSPPGSIHLEIRDPAVYIDDHNLSLDNARPRVERVVGELDGALCWCYANPTGLGDAEAVSAGRVPDPGPSEG